MQLLFCSALSNVLDVGHQQQHSPTPSGAFAIVIQPKAAYRLSQRELCLQGCSRNRHPLIVHACTSSQNPLTTGQFFQHIQAYHLPPFRVILGPYPKYQGLNIVSNSRHLRAVRYALAEAKFVVLCGVLRAAGREHLARKLFAGWKVCHCQHEQPHTLCFNNF